MFSIQAEDFDWPQCSVVDCQGAQLNGGRCVRHLDGDEARGDVLADIDRTGDIDVRGVRLDADLVQELIKRCPVVGERVRVRNLRCDLARFEGEAEFADMTLENASFYAARFEAEPSFEDLVFEK